MVTHDLNLIFEERETNHNIFDIHFCHLVYIYDITFPITRCELKMLLNEQHL